MFGSTRRLVSKILSSASMIPWTQVSVSVVHGSWNAGLRRPPRPRPPPGARWATRSATARLPAWRWSVTIGCSGVGREGRLGRVEAGDRDATVFTLRRMRHDRPLSIGGAAVVKPRPGGPHASRTSSERAA